MILYFSATGNSKYVATRIAQAIGQNIVSIADCIHENKYTFEEETIGIISPTYDWGTAKHRQRISGKSFFSNEIYVFYCNVWNNTGGNRPYGK